MSKLFLRTYFILSGLFLGVLPIHTVAAEEITVDSVYLGIEEEAHIPLTLLEVPIEDNGYRGAELAFNDNLTTGRFLGHVYTLDIVHPEISELETTFLTLIENGIRFFIVDLEVENLKKIAALPEAEDVILFNIRAPDNELRNESCSQNTLHVLPSRAMLADGLAQFLIWKRWNEWFVVIGQSEKDALYAESIFRAAKRFGADITDEVVLEFEAGSRRSDSGHAHVQQVIPSMTQTGDYDITVVADESDVFGEYLSYRTYRPRPVAGTQGLIPTSWHRSHEQWGGTQLQRRFKKLADRDMTPRDYSAWVAMRALGEAVTKANSSVVSEVRAALFDPTFKLAAFKGVPLTFRTWNGQLRQPILVSGARSLVTVSPQMQFLHERTPLDTMGFDLQDSSCKEFNDAQ